MHCSHTEHGQKQTKKVVTSHFDHVSRIAVELQVASYIAGYSMHVYHNTTTNTVTIYDCAYVS